MLLLLRDCLCLAVKFVYPMDWKAIRSLGGAQHKGFEELCVQLARSVIPSGCRLLRNGTPDGGVECYATFETGDEWGWQSKYVHSFEDSQWSQIDNSVETALATHPKLTHYHICAPLDLPDARQQNRKSARDRWNDHRSKWIAWANARQMKVEFVWWGSSELLDLLSLPDNAGRVLFWFGSPGRFDQAWFESHLASAAKSAGPRYTPELHVELPISKKFEAFGRTSGLIDRVCSTAEGLQREYKWIARWDDSDETPGLGFASQQLKTSVSCLMSLLDQFTEQPNGNQGLGAMIAVTKQALNSFDTIEKCLEAINEDVLCLPVTEDEDEKKVRRQRVELLTARRRSLQDFKYELRSASKTYSTEEKFAETQTLILTGEAGTGKTHLLCDIAKQRMAENRPTVLLLGQCFTSTTAPSVQVAQMLGFPTASLVEIVGCLEATAQSANARCLILIDALNEGMGRQFWKPHLTEFVEAIKASPWLAVGFSVRTCYMEAVIPEAVINEAALAEHHGFEEVEHEAVKFFFLEHGLEFASAPVFSREFTNPLFLKTLCRGLKKTGARTLPRGFHGITKVFELYLEATETELAEQLDYPRSQKLITKALRSLVDETTKANQPFLPADQGRAILDCLLPGRRYSDSLYKALHDCGLLMESLSYAQGEPRDVVAIAYERWADHLAAKALLDEHLDSAQPAKAFKIGGPLALYGEGFSMRDGIREALSIQVPERVGRELLSLMPYALREWGMADAFLHSVVWRDPASCTPAMLRLMDFIEANDLAHHNDVWDVRITVSTIPGHALNITSMDRWLRRTPMPDRDADWSIAIYRAWDNDHSICHLVDWAWRVERGSPLDADSVWLAALTLCWCFTCSHRFLRDRATKAAVNLLDGRLKLAAQLVTHFAEVDDLYVRERVLAVACGVALRSRNAEEVGELAEAVYQTVFSFGTPPAHILLRDYARCVIERAIHLGCSLTFDPTISKPPYHSVWPTIPSKEEIVALETDWQEIGKSLPDSEWAKHDIIRSVESGDFSRYVIGTNHGSSDWLSLRVSAPRWVPASSQIEEIISTLSQRQQRLWRAIERLRNSRLPHFEYYLAQIRGGQVPPIPDDELNMMRRKADLKRQIQSRLLSRFNDSLSSETKDWLTALAAERDKPGGDKPPQFDLSVIQRYITKRVFDLGWTVERFGWFDRHHNRTGGREAMKAERIGKKYQWIAYHEINALMADHFQYNADRWGTGRSVVYEGPWQDHLRDIDPTHGIKALPEAVKGRAPWWETIRYDNWQSGHGGSEWAMNVSDYPDIRRLLTVTDPQGVRWINAYGFYSWERKRLPSQGYDDSERRDVWTHIHAWLVKRQDTQTLLDWIDSIDVGNSWMPHQLPHETSVFLAEHSWATASLFYGRENYGHDGWHHRAGSPVEVFSISVEYLEERSTFDCSMDEGFTLLMPTPELTRKLDLRWTGRGADFETVDGILFSTDPTAHEAGRKCHLLREDLLKNYLDANNLSLVWAVRGEKNHYGPKHSYDDFFGLRFSGVFELTRDGIKGEMRHRDAKDRTATSY